MKNYISPTTTHYPIRTTHPLCASGTPPTPPTGKVSFGIRIINTEPAEIIL